jgi:peptidoglycan/xylan/chitin deacetylase (PgdA/CDA1 family)
VALRLKNVLKQTAYRTVGEAANLIGRSNKSDALRILMYHKVNDIPGNPTTITVDTFRAQVAALVALGCRVVDLDTVLAHYRGDGPLPPRAVLLTFDDGYQDVLVNALPVLREHDFPAVMFVSVDHITSGAPFPHELRARDAGISNPVLTWEGALELEAGGVRIESHGLTHRPLASLTADEARHEIVASKAELEARLSRPVTAYAFPKGSRADYSTEHALMLSEAGYALGFTTVARGNKPDADPLQLGRYNGEAYSPRTFELLIRGACDGIALKDSVAGTHAKVLFNRALRTKTD